MKVRRVDLYPDEWLAGTGVLDAAETGIYITACALIYSHGGPIPKEELRCRIRGHGNAFNRAYARLLELGKLVENDGEITNKRCENELQKADKRIINAQENGGKSSGRPRKNKEIDNQPGLQTEKLTTNHQPPTTNQEDSVGSNEPTAAPAALPAPLAVVAGTAHDPKRELYDLGKQVLGKSGGGQITKLIAYHAGDLEAAKYTMNQVVAAAYPAEYLGKILNREVSAPYDFDADMRRMGVSPDGTSFGDAKWVDPLKRPGDDGRGNLQVVG